MAFEFVCPFCHTRIRVSDHFAGQSGPCAECGNQVTMPGSAPEGTTGGSFDRNRRPHYIGNYSLKKAFSLPVLRLLFSLSIIASLVAFASVILFPTARNAFSLRQRTLALSNAKQIADALNAYRRTYGSYPPPVVNDEKGKPLYSWRVLILPQLGYGSLFNNYQLDQTWDSPTNIDLMNRMPPVYACPDNVNALAMHETNFALIVGPGSLFPPGPAINPDTMLDDPGETLLVAETKDGAYSWTQPGDLLTSNGIAIGLRPMVDLGGNFSECVVAATVDGTPIAINPSISRASLDAIISPNGRETIDLSAICLPTKK